MSFLQFGLLSGRHILLQGVLVVTFQLAYLLLSVLVEDLARLLLNVFIAFVFEYLSAVILLLFSVLHLGRVTSRYLVGGALLVYDILLKHY